jgi:hypothetical protein
MLLKPEEIKGNLKAEDGMLIYLDHEKYYLIGPLSLPFTIHHNDKIYNRYYNNYYRGVKLIKESIIS